MTDKDPIEFAYATRSRQLWSYARRLGLASGDAEDVMHEAFARALANGATIVDLSPWLFRVVHNLSIDRLRHTRPAVDTAPEGAPWTEDERLALWDEVDRLPPTQRSVLYLHYRADFDFPTVARILNMSEGGVRAAASRAVARLRQETST